MEFKSGFRNLNLRKEIKRGTSVYNGIFNHKYYYSSKRLRLLLGYLGIFSSEWISKTDHGKLSL